MVKQYFDTKKLDKTTLEETFFIINDNKYIMYTASGVFSRKGLDFGTRLLLESVPISDIAGSVLDIGCGAGPIGIYLAKNTDAKVIMSDVNEAAVELSEINLAKNNAEAEVILSDGYDNINGKFDFIITNPPVRVGYKKLLEIIRDAKNLLTNDGVLYYVIRKQQGGERLIRDTGDVFDSTIIIKKKGYFIVKAK